ncbi:MAG: LysR family transcriptional regulator [bacterium]
MGDADLNLLITLDVLLTEGSVAGAAARLQLSPSAMSRALARLRQVTGDPLLVRAGRGLVPTPHALAMRGEVGRVVEAARSVLRPSTVDLQQVKRVIVLRSREGFVEAFGAALIARVAAAAPGITLRFVPKPDKDAGGLRDGRVDLETGVVEGTPGPELRAQALFHDHFVGVMRLEHPIGAAGFSAAGHVVISRRGQDHDVLDAGLTQSRRMAAVVSTYAEALALVRGSDLMSCVPERLTRALRHGVASFALPVAVPGITLSLLWHPRQDADPAHRWLRNVVRQVCQGPTPELPV